MKLDVTLPRKIDPFVDGSTTDGMLTVVVDGDVELDAVPELELLEVLLMVFVAEDDGVDVDDDVVVSDEVVVLDADGDGEADAVDVIANVHSNPVVGVAPLYGHAAGHCILVTVPVPAELGGPP